MAKCQHVTNEFDGYFYIAALGVGVTIRGELDLTKVVADDQQRVVNRIRQPACISYIPRQELQSRQGRGTIQENAKTAQIQSLRL